MSTKIFNLIETNKEDFINFWSQKYHYPLEEKYTTNIGEPFTKDRITNLFIWKNGRNLSFQKHISINNNYISYLENLPNLNNKNDGRDYFEQLNGGIIWNFFWLHCLNRNLFPIFDQHTYRACKFITNNFIHEISELDNNNKSNFYFSNYIEFFEQFIDNENRRVDKALFMYGKFLKKWY